MTTANVTPLRSRRHWLPPLAIVLLGIVPVWAVQAGALAITRKPSADVVIILAVMEIAFFLWVRIFSRLSLIRQAMLIASFAAVQLGLYSSIRLDGFAGDGRPMWSWRWTPTVEERFAASRSAAAQRDTRSLADFSHPSPNDSPGFRGADRTGTTATELEIDWTAHPPRELWRRDVGQSWSSFATVGDYCVTHEQRGDAETVVCYHLPTGLEVWTHVEAADFFEVTSSRGPRATPTIHRGRVYALGATGVLVCLEGRDGQLCWKRDILSQHKAENRIFGVAGSPLAIDDLLIVAPGGQGSSLAAYDAASGDLVWKNGDAGASYSSPQLVTIASQPQILHFNADGLTGHAVDTGEVLWHIEWISNPVERNNVAQPVVIASRTANSRVLVSSAYGMGTGLFEMRPRNGTLQPQELWRSQQLQSKFSSVVVVDGHAYGIDLGILACLDLATGERTWKRGRYGYGQLLLAGSTLVVQMESGAVALVAARSDRFEELARLDALDDRTWNQPVLTGDRLLVRNDREAACFRLQLRSPPAE